MGFREEARQTLRQALPAPRAIHQDREAAEGRERYVNAGSRSTCLFLEAETTLFSKQGCVPAASGPWVGPQRHRCGAVDADLGVHSTIGRVRVGRTVSGGCHFPVHDLGWVT